MAAIFLGLLLAALTALGAATSSAPAQNPTELQQKVDELENVQSAQGGVEAEIERQNAQINDLIAREAAVREREAAVQEELDAAQARLDGATAELNAERDHLEALRERLGRAVGALEDYLVEVYKSDNPDVISVILRSASWSEAMAQVEYMESVEEHQNAVIERVNALRAEVRVIVERLANVRERIEQDRDAIAAQRDEVAEARAEIESHHAELEVARAERRASLRELQSEERELQKEIEPSAAPPGGATASLVDGRAIAPANAPLAVKSAIEAGNRIVGRPYVWGGGHGSFESSGYDCSGAVGYMLHGGGWLSSPLDSTGLSTWGSPGPGSWVTVYGSPGHAYAVVAGLRFDTSGTVGGSGPSWSTEMRSPAGFIARHPDGY
jgi:peptidoglycan hydrolase CwlO-like protein